MEIDPESKEDSTSIMEIDPESKEDSTSMHSNKDNKEDEDEEDNNSQIEKEIELIESKSLEESEKEKTPDIQKEEKSIELREEKSNTTISPFYSNQQIPTNEKENDEILIQGDITYCQNVNTEAFTAEQLTKDKNTIKSRLLKTKRSNIKTNGKKRNNRKKKIPMKSLWIPITPQMILHTLYRLRFFKLGPTKKEIIANLILHYPVRNQFNELAREMRQKLRCAVQSGLLNQNGPHYKLNSKETKGNRLQKRQINDFWRYYLELRPVSEPRKSATPIDYEPFAEPL